MVLIFVWTIFYFLHPFPAVRVKGTRSWAVRILAALGFIRSLFSGNIEKKSATWKIHFRVYKLWISVRLIFLTRPFFIILTAQSGQRNIIIYINIIVSYYIIYILWKGHTLYPSLLPFPASNILKIFTKTSKT